MRDPIFMCQVNGEYGTTSEILTAQPTTCTAENSWPLPRWDLFMYAEGEKTVQESDFASTIKKMEENSRYRRLRWNALSGPKRGALLWPYRGSENPAQANGCLFAKML